MKKSKFTETQIVTILRPVASITDTFDWQRELVLGFKAFCVRLDGWIVLSRIVILGRANFLRWRSAGPDDLSLRWTFNSTPRMITFTNRSAPSTLQMDFSGATRFVERDHNAVEDGFTIETR